MSIVDPDPKYKLSARQREILRFIEQFCASESRPPTIREIQLALKMSSTSVVDYNLKGLVKAGLIRRATGISRGIELVAQPHSGQESLRIPVFGTIAAGSPIEVPENPPDPAVWDDLIEVSPEYVKGSAGGVFALRVRGHSMVDALIGDGDIVILRQQDTAENGETVAVYIEPERSTTLKRFYSEGDTIRLQPANPTMEPMYFPSGQVHVQGSLVGVIRQIA